MRRKQLRGSIWLIIALGAGLTACSPSGDLSISNEGPDNVTVSTGDQEFTVDADGGVQILDSGCTEGDISVDFPSGDTIVVAGPVCPDKEVVIRDGRVNLQSSPAA